MAIPREVIEEILYRTDIEELVGSYVTLKRAGSNLSGLCPFHSEKTPSFSVSPAKKFFYCFGCGAGGDAITFVMKAENLDYIQAVEFLAKRAGITDLILCEDNRKDVSEIKPAYLAGLNFHYVRTNDDVLKLALQ